MKHGLPASEITPPRFATPIDQRLRPRREAFGKRHVVMPRSALQPGSLNWPTTYSGRQSRDALRHLCGQLVWRVAEKKEIGRLES